MPIVASTLSTASAAAPSIDPFYDPPSPLPGGAPSDLIRVEPMTVSFDPLKAGEAVGVSPGAPARISPNADAWRIMYHSTSATDTPTAVTGTLMVPRTPWPSGPRSLVAYAVGSHGMGPQCTPSIQFHEGTQYEFPLIASYLNLGWAVVATDYQRFGPPNVHMYVIQKAQGYAMLDAIRAATKVPGSGITPASPAALVGYSQGGHAAAAAAELHPGYAPELPIRGTAAGGVPAELRAVARAVDRDVLFGVVPMNGAALEAAYLELSLDGLNDTGRAALEEVKTQCIAETTRRWAFRSSTKLTVGGKTIDQFLDGEPQWSARVDEQRLGWLVPTAPVLLYHGLLDPWVPYVLGEQLARQWCARGTDVTFTTYPAAEHLGALIEATPEVQAWLAARFAGLPVPNGC